MILKESEFIIEVLLFTALFSSGSSIHSFLDDRITDFFELLSLFIIFFLFSLSIWVQEALAFLKGFVQSFLFVRWKLSFKFLLVVHRWFNWVNVVVQSLSSVNFFLSKFILFGELFGFSQHSFDLLVRKFSVLILDHNVVLLSWSLFNSSNWKNGVLIDFKGDFNLRSSSWGGWNTGQVESSQQVVVFGQWSLTFEYLNCDSLLVVSISCENLRFFSGNVRPFWNNLAHNTTNCFNT